MLWSDFKALVLKLMTDSAPADGSARLFVEAIARYVRARAVLEIIGRGNEALALAKTHENEFRRLRCKLAGRTCTLSDADLVTAVRARLIETKVDDAMAVSAIGEYVKSRLALKVDEEPELAAAYAANWGSVRLRMLGHTLTIERAVMKTQVRTYLGDDAYRLSEADSTEALIDAHAERAADEIEALKAWVELTILAGREEFEAVKRRVDEEMINGVIDLQTHIEGLRDGNFSRYTIDDVLPDGYASRGKIPENCRPVAAWIEYPEADDEEDTEDGMPEGCAKVACVPVPWSRVQSMKCVQTCEPWIAFERTGRCFTVGPALVEDEIEFLLQWEGIKQSYADADETPFDRQAAQAVAYYIESKLAVADEDANAARFAGNGFIQVRKSLWREKRESRQLAVSDDVEL